MHKRLLFLMLGVVPVLFISLSYFYGMAVAAIVIVVVAIPFEVASLVIKSPSIERPKSKG